MKKQLIILAAVCVLLTGCTGAAGNTEGNASEESDITTKSTAVTSRPQGTEVPVIDSTRKDRAFLALDTAERQISAELVLLDGESKDALEAVQKDALTRYINTLAESELSLTRQAKDIEKFKDFSVMSIDLDAELTLCDTDMISIMYTGEAVFKDAAQPVHLAFSLNLDAHTLKEVSFSERYMVGEEMYGMFASASAEAMTAKWGEKYEEEVGSFADAVCKSEDFSARIADGSIIVYYTENDAVLSFPIASELGGRIEVAVPHVQLDFLKADTSPLKVLTESGDYSITYESFPDIPDTADYYISAIGSDSFTVSRYLGNFPIRAVTHASLLESDVDGDKKKEIILNMAVSSEGSTLTAVFKMNGGVLEECAVIDLTKLTFKCEYINGKKAKLSSEDGKYTQEFDISAVFDAGAFDKNGKAAGEGIVSIKSIAEIKQENGKVICSAVFTLDGINAGEIQLVLSVKDGEYLLTPTAPKKN